jgi:hypothetical protein
MRKHEARQSGIAIEVQCAPPSLSPSKHSGSFIISWIGAWSPVT